MLEAQVRRQTTSLIEAPTEVFSTSRETSFSHTLLIDFICKLFTIVTKVRIDVSNGATLIDINTNDINTSDH